MSYPTISVNDVLAAEERIRLYIRPTPLLESPLFNEAHGFRMLVKAEVLQTTGSFKERGARNAIAQLGAGKGKRGILAMSAGNHAQAVAYVAQQEKIPAVIVMPLDAPRVKMARTKAYGAEVITYDRAGGQDREAIGQRIAQERGLTLIHPYNAFATIAGQGTIGLEISRQTQALGVSPDAIIVPCSGGGMAAGIALTRGLYDVPPQIYTAEPKGLDDARRSLEAARIVANRKTSDPLCDALTAPHLGENPFQILRANHAEGLATRHAFIRGAMYFALTLFNIKLEGGGATALACAMSYCEEFKGKTVVVIASGGNVDDSTYMRAIARGRASLKSAALVS